MVGPTDKSRDENLAGIRLILEEMGDLKKELAMDRKQAAEDRKQAAEDRKQAAEDRKQAADDRKRIAETMDRIEDSLDKSIVQAARDRAEAAHDRKEIRRALVVIGNIGRRFSQSLERIRKTQEEIRDLLKHKNGDGGPGPLLKPRSPSPPSRRR